MNKEERFKRLKEDEKIRREPIALSRTDIAVIHLFHRMDSLEEMWMWDSEKLYEENYNLYEQAARQFMVQLDGRYNNLFLKALKKEIELRLKDDPC